MFDEQNFGQGGNDQIVMIDPNLLGPERGSVQRHEDEDVNFDYGTSSP